jgi:hypothetical protein
MYDSTRRTGGHRRVRSLHTLGPVPAIPRLGGAAGLCGVIHGTGSTLLRADRHMTARGAGVGEAANRRGGRGGAREGASAEAASDRGMRHDVSTTTCSVQHAACSSNMHRATCSTRRVMYMFDMLTWCTLSDTLALSHITRVFSTQEERAKVNASIAEPQTRLAERAPPVTAPVRAAAPRACGTAISRCPSHR